MKEKQKLNTQKWEEINEVFEATVTISSHLKPMGIKDIFELVEQDSIESMLDFYDALPITISPEHWELLQKYISQDLSSNDKKAISDFISLAASFHELAMEQPRTTYSKLRDEIIAFKETMIELMPIGESQKNRDNFRYALSVDIQETMKKNYQALSADALSHVNYAFYLMWHTDAFYNPLALIRPTTYPSQYYCAATVALERLTQQLKDETGFYRSIFDLWQGLGETDFEVTYNQQYDPPRMSPLLGFTDTLLRVIASLTNTYIKKTDSIRKDLAKYKKIIGI